MGLIITPKVLRVILLTTVLIFKIIDHSEVEGGPVETLLSASKATYIKIDHELMPRKIENINDLSPLPVPPGRNFAMRKYPVSKRQIQEIILEINDKKESNTINTYQPSSVRESGSWKNESDIHRSKLKSVLGTDGEVYYDGDWGLMSAILTCYNNHWVLKTGPEDWWTVVIRRIVQAMDEHGDVPQVRNFFVEHKDKKKIEVTVGATLSNINYNWLFSQFSNKIRANIKIPSYVDIIENDFSSSTDEQTMISHIMLMSSMKSYFEFGIGTACGIPGVEMKGTEEDWVKLIDKINRLESLLAPIDKYLHLNDWFSNAKKVFINLLDTYKGKPNNDWWGNILSWEKRWGSGQRSHWSGWFPEFFGAEYAPNHYKHFPSDLVTVPIHISDINNQPPVVDDGILMAGIVGFNVEAGVRAPIVEPKHAWSLLLPEDSPVAERLTRQYTGAVKTRHEDDYRRGTPTVPIIKLQTTLSSETQIGDTSKTRIFANKIPYKTNNTVSEACKYYCMGEDNNYFCCETPDQRKLLANTSIVMRMNNIPENICKYWCTGVDREYFCCYTSEQYALQLLNSR